ncbi:MAG: pilus assembly PilX N-terminal domain-containing protein [Candidatus Krumholzibacteriia bacterium]
MDRRPPQQPPRDGFVRAGLVRADLARADLARDGFALVTTLLIILVLSVIAMGAAWLASTEKRVSFAEGVHVSATFAADAGGEAGINFLRLADVPPSILDFGNFLVRSHGTTNLQSSQDYRFNAHYVRKRPKPGWGVAFLDYDYRVVSRGTASTSGETAVELVASRLFKEGY